MQAKYKKVFVAQFFIICSLSAASIFGQSAIRRIDFNNFTYSALCGGENETDVWTIPVKNGKLENTRQVDGVDQLIDDQLPSYFAVGEPLYGDLTGDGKEEAVVQTECNTGGTALFTEGYIYTIKNNRPELIFRIEGGSKAYGSLASVRVLKGILAVERNDPQGASECCPQYTVTKQYKWNGKTFILFGKPRYKKLVGH